MIVSYEVNGTDWKLVGIRQWRRDAGRKRPPGEGGLGTSLVKALAQQLDAKVEIVSGPKGVSVSITHATFTSRLPSAA